MIYCDFWLSQIGTFDANYSIQIILFVKYQIVLFIYIYT